MKDRTSGVIRIVAPIGQSPPILPPVLRTGETSSAPSPDRHSTQAADLH
ncbi:hypothetical protein [Aureimonas sp. AU20]|nr:hypothetical protein [Aureimonas sp. AU20]